MPIAAPPLAISQAPQGDGNTPLQIPWYPWDQDEWCWAACAQMLAFFYQNTLTPQCNFVSQILSDPTVCQNPASFNSPLDVSKVEEVFALFGKSGPYVDHPLTFEQVQGEIQAGRPLEVGFQWSNNNAHVVVVAGAAQNDSGQFVYINDPDPEFACGWCTFSNVQSAYGRGSWQWTWMPIQ